MTAENLAKTLMELSVKTNTSIIQALNQMDKSGRKLLMVYKEDVFFSLLSIGNIQRAIIQKCAFDTPVEHILRNNVTVAKNSDSLHDIRELMLKNRTEFMPILDDEGKLRDIVFWDDLKSELHHESRKYLQNIPVIIMAGGRGSRLKPITNVIPKPLIPLGEKPIIEIITDQFHKFGATSFYISINYKGEMIKRFYEELTDKKYEIEYFQETKPLGTAGSLYLLKGKIKDTFFVTNCDILVDQDYNDVLLYHRENRNDLTIVSAIKKYPIPYGTIETTGHGLLKELKEKPELIFQINSGVYILEPSLLDRIPEDAHFDITELIESIQKTNGRVGVWPVSEGSWLDIGDWNEYLERMKLMKESFKFFG